MQTAEDYNRGTGWSTLADKFNFALLFPQQRRSNNAIRGFNWFEIVDKDFEQIVEAIGIRVNAVIEYRNRFEAAAAWYRVDSRSPQRKLRST